MNTYSDLNRFYPEDEIDLVDLWLYLQRHRWVFAVVLLICLIGGVVTATVLPTTYNYKLTIEVGGMRNAGSDVALAEYLESSASIQTRLKESIAPAIASQMRAGGTDAGLYDQLTVDMPKDAGMAIISVEATQDQQDQALTFLESVASRLVEAHKQLLDKQVGLLRNHATQRLAEVDQQIASVRETREKFALPGNDEASAITSMLVSQQIPRLLELKSDLTKQLTVDLEGKIHATRVIAGPARSLKPESPGLILIMAMAMLAGIFLGAVVVMLAVLKEQADSRKRRIAAPIESRHQQESSDLHRRTS